MHNHDTSKKSIFLGDDGRNFVVPFALITSLFFLWGFCNGLIDLMDKHFQSTLSLTKAESSLVQFANYMGYFFMALPAGLLARRYGYKGGILIGLTLIATGALWFIPAIHIGQFWAFLVGLFVLATGMTCLETIANPYATVLGSAKHAATRINLAQSCNGIGWIMGPVVGGTFIMSKTSVSNTSNQSLFIPYMGIAVAVAILIAIFSASDIPDIKPEDDYHLDDAVPTEHAKSIWAHPHFVLAVVAQFFYVAAQTGIFSYFVNYITQDIPAVPASLANSMPAGWAAHAVGSTVYHVTDFGGSKLLGWGGFTMFLLGRFVGTLILRFASAHKTLAAFSVLAAISALTVFLDLGWISVVALFASFFLMSIMFPTIFALGIHGLGTRSKIASSFIVMAIVGGALMPYIMGTIADAHHGSMTPGFIVPFICFIVVALYAFTWPATSKSEGLVGVSATGGH
jgi:FHS family L-fucose permease-like MFS transporter